MKSIEEYDFNGKRALIRVDFNVPLNDKMEVTDATRIRAAVPTIITVLEGGGSVVLMSHLGRPENKFDENLSLKHIIPALEKELGVIANFAGNCIGENAKEMTANLTPGEVIILENLRFHKEEAEGDEFFAGHLAVHGDCFINDAFGTAHRAHASTTTVANFFPKDKMFGKLMSSELQNLDKVLKSSEKPVLAIIGGAKISSKITVLENILSQTDEIIIGGGMSYTFIQADGGKVGNSLVEKDLMDTAKSLVEKAAYQNVSLHLPLDSVIADEFRNDASTDLCSSAQIPDGWMGLDIGPEAIEKFTEVIMRSKVILWNGPMGVFEMENFSKGTEAIAKALVKATENGAFTLVGGGDSVAAINKFKLADKVSYVSTGGGAMLEYLEGKVLPGVAAILED